jgi:hypothetical protein
MILPLYVCRECGKFGGLALSFLQTMSRSEYKDGDHKRVYCPDGHGLMYEVQDEDRLAVLPATVEARREELSSPDGPQLPLPRNLDE